MTLPATLSRQRPAGILSPRWLGRGLALLLMVAIAVVVLYPLAIVLFTAFKTEADLARNPLGVPRQWTAQNFRMAWNEAGMSKLMLNSVVVSVAVVVGTVLLSGMGGFALGRLDFPGRMFVPVLLTTGLVIPMETLIIPLFYTLKPLGLLNTYWALVLPQMGLGLPFGILLLRGFIRDLPQELFDAAEIDGCDLWPQFLHLVLPLTRSALVALAVFQFLWSWNQYLLPLVMIQSPPMRTIPLGLSFFVGRYQTAFGGLAAAAVIALLPIFAFYVLFNRQIMRANLAGALK